jgi:Pvc16 N-terminal domain
MIHDVDESLKALIRREALNGTDIEVVFDAPTKEWASRRNAPTLDVYLYDIREDLRRREVGIHNVRADDGHISERRKPPRFFKLSYLVTAWTQRPEDEHRLLSAVLGCFVRHDCMPVDILAGTLTDQTLPIPVTVGLPPPEDRSLSDVWSAMGGELKPSLDLVVHCPLDTRQTFEAGPPVREAPRFNIYAGDAEPETKKGKGRHPAKGSQGPGVPARAPRASKEAAPSRVARRPARERGVLAEEKVKAGADDTPGRVFGIRQLDDT